MTDAQMENLTLAGADDNDADELERRRIKRIRESDFARELPALQIAYELARSELAQPRTYGLTKAERVLFGVPVEK